MTLTILNGRALARPFGSSALGLSSRGDNDSSDVRNVAHHRKADRRRDGFGVNATVTNLFVVTLRAVRRLTARHSPRFAIRNLPRIDGECESF